MKELEKEDLKDRRFQKILTRIAMYKKDMAERLSASKKNLKARFTQWTYTVIQTIATDSARLLKIMNVRKTQVLIFSL